MRTLAAIMLFGIVGIAVPSRSPAMQPKGTMHAVTLHPSTRSFKELEVACAGALGSVTFAMNHVRSHAMSGVNVSEKSNGGVSVITFSDQAHHKSATVKANAHNHTVSGIDVTVKLSGSVACVQ